MRRNSILAGVFSALVPGLGKMYAGQSLRGATVLFAVLVVGNLNAIWLSTYAVEIHLGDSPDFWMSILPRILHDLFAFYGIAFLVWQIVDAYILDKKRSQK